MDGAAGPLKAGSAARLENKIPTPDPSLTPEEQIA